MYHENGDFGQVRLASLIPTLQNKGLFYLHSVGWHKCNDLYQISHPDGNEDHLLLITTGGCGSMKIEDTTYDLPAGTIAFIPRNVANSYGTPKDGLWEFYWLHPCGSAANGFLDAVARRGSFLKSFNTDRDYAQRIEKLISLCTERTNDTSLQLSQKLSELLHLVALDLCESPKAPSLSTHVISYIEQHYDEPLKLEDIAGTLFISTAHLIRIFKKENGCTPHQYLVKYRLLSAAELLKFSELQVKEIAAQVGFSSSSHFSNCFYKRYGCTPLQYQDQSAIK